MPRPADVTPEFLAASDAEIERFRAAQRAGSLPPGTHRIPDALFEVPHFRESWHVGRWLHEKLLAAGCPDAEARDACFANGQRAAMAADPWPATVATLERYRAGRGVETPGPDLADRLLAGERPEAVG
jgi:hypothetical protein